MIITVLPECTYSIIFEIKPKIPPHQEVTNVMTNVSESEKRNIEYQNTLSKVTVSNIFPHANSSLTVASCPLYR